MKKQIVNAIVAFLLFLMPMAVDAAIGIGYQNPSSHCKTNSHENPLLPTIITSLVNITACQDMEFDVDIAVANFTNVGSVSLALNYDTSDLTYLGYENLHSTLADGMLFVNARDGVVYVSWMSLGGATIGNGTLMSLKFFGVAGSSTLAWYTSRCEYANIQGMVFPDSYQDGTVTIYSAPYIINQPSNMTIYEGSNTSFSVSAGGNALNYQWQSRSDESSIWVNLANDGHYGNVTDSTLNIYNATLEMNGRQYRCVVGGECEPEIVSDQAVLTVNIGEDFYQVVVAASPENAGEVTGGEIYNYGDTCTLIASANYGFIFVNWTKGGVEVSISPTYSFTVTESASYVAHFMEGSEITQSMNLTQGWNWFSTNLDITLDDLKTALVAALGNTTIVINSQSAGNTTYNGSTWRGTLNALDIAQMYMIEINSNCEIMLMGTSINPAEYPITIRKGFNWISFPFNQSMSVSNAFTGFAINGDMVISQFGSATYNGSIWRGSLSTLEPGKGYMYNSNVQGHRIFTFPIDK